MMRRFVIIARHELRLYGSEFLPALLYLVMPLVIIAFVKDTFSIYLHVIEHRPAGNGAQLAVPGQATMFGFMTLAMFGYFFLGEHGWRTWDRLRSLRIGVGEILVAKLAIAYVHQLAQFAVLITAGIVLFDVHVNGSWTALVAIELVTALMIVSYGSLAAAFASSQAQFNAFAYLGALLMAGLGGALTPFGTLPSWARAAGPAVPTYWSAKAFRTVILDRGSWPDIVVPVAALLGFAALFLTLAALEFRPDDRKSTFA